ncbi:helix-turn-helix domain-containing protein [Flavobacterium microcysteis]|uniref:Helix-turn-helix transcriptional regulator n=1 Tax=Flavobacterium microcysteis TaxID=2596891 RepID=A0A501QGJ3_9FLAO|nr:helix-turn-helix transcriptional regulator [Flavobacterium microcysteis]TPD71231.1 helix-turn-helix transcriptional regulator [Flavobacterium microcysteis]
MFYDKNKIGESIKIQRIARGWTQNQLSERSGIGLRSIQRIENGEVNARSYTLTKLQEELDIRFDETHALVINQEPDFTIQSIFSNRTQKILMSYSTGFIIAIVSGIFLVRSATFPETNFELFALVCSLISVYSAILLYIWRKSK